MQLNARDLLVEDNLLHIPSIRYKIDTAGQRIGARIHHAQSLVPVDQWVTGGAVPLAVMAH